MTTPITPERIAELRALEQKATRAPWRADRYRDLHVGNWWFDHLPEGSAPIESTGTCMALGVAVGASPTKENAAFIAAARNALPDLLDEVVRQRSKRAFALEVLADFVDAYEWGSSVSAETYGKAQTLLDELENES